MGDERVGNTREGAAARRWQVALRCLKATSARALALGVVCLALAAGPLTGCLPPVASDAELLDALAQAKAADADVGGAGKDGTPASDASAETAEVDAAPDAGPDSGGKDGLEVDGDGGEADGGGPDGAGNLGAACSTSAGCFTPVGAAPCKQAICDAGSCVLGVAAKGQICAAVGLQLAPCQETRCDDVGACIITTAADGASCDADDDGCTGPDVCKAGTCGAGPVITCPSDGNACAKPSCASTGAATSVCKPVFKAAGEVCDDGKFCTIKDQCDGGGVCAGELNPCTGNGGPCATPFCDVDKGVCASKPKLAGLACDDDSPCTQAGTCDAAGVCANLKSLCDDSNPCTEDLCSGQGACSNVPLTLACSDGDACTTGDACDGKGKCASGKPRLFDVSFDDKPGVVIRGTLDLVGGDVVMVGERAGAPYLVRSDLFGNPGLSLATGGYVGTWMRALERNDGLLLAGMSQPNTSPHAPLFARTDSTGKQLFAVTLSAEAVTGVHLAALLPGPSPELAMVALQQPAAGSVTIVRLLLWSEATKAAVPGKDVTLGGPGDPYVLNGGAHEPAASRYLLVGRRQVVKATKAWHGWVHRRLDSMLYGGEQDYMPTGSTGGDLQAVTVLSGGYLAAGAATVASGEVGWLLRLDDKLAPVWQQKLAAQADDTVLYGARLASWGEVLAIGYASTGPNAADTASVVWRVRADGTPLASALWPAGGGWLRGVRALGDGGLVTGASGLGSKSVAQMARTSPWLHRTCVEAGGCAALGASACDDGNACVAPGCIAGTGCKAKPLASGTACTGAKSCDGTGVCK